jgi:hypothetical protein
MMRSCAGRDSDVGVLAVAEFVILAAACSGSNSGAEDEPTPLGTASPSAVEILQ